MLKADEMHAVILGIINEQLGIIIDSLYQPCTQGNIEFYELFFFISVWKHSYSLLIKMEVVVMEGIMLSEKVKTLLLKKLGVCRRVVDQCLYIL